MKTFFFFFSFLGTKKGTKNPTRVGLLFLFVLSWHSSKAQSIIIIAPDPNWPHRSRKTRFIILFLLSFTLENMSSSPPLASVAEACEAVAGAVDEESAWCEV